MNYKEIIDQITVRIDEIDEPLRLANIAYGEATEACKKSRTKINIQKRGEVLAVYTTLRELDNALNRAKSELLIARIADSSIIIN